MWTWTWALVQLHGLTSALWLARDHSTRFQPFNANQNFYLVFGEQPTVTCRCLGRSITATYQTNSGSTGNVGANTITIYLNPPTGMGRIAGVIRATNLTAASGGAFAESTQSVQSPAPASLLTLNRGVTVNDINTGARNIRQEQCK